MYSGNSYECVDVHTTSQKHTNSRNRDNTCVWRDWQMLLPGSSCSFLAPVLRWVVCVSNDTQTLALHTLICNITTTIIASVLCDEPDSCVSAWACFCVHRTGTCLPFGGMYSIYWCESSMQWSGVQTHSVLLDGPEIPLCAPRGMSEEF